MSRESTDPRPVAAAAKAASAVTELEPATRTAIWANVVGLVVSLTIALVVILTAIDVQSARIPTRKVTAGRSADCSGPTSAAA